MLIPPWAILPGPMARFPPLPDRLAFIAFWIVAVARSSTRFAIQPDRVAISMGAIAYLRDGLHIYLRDARGGGVSRREAIRAARTQIGRRSTDHLVLFKTQGPLFYLNPPDPLPEFEISRILQDAIAKGDVEWMIVRRRDMPKLDTPIEDHRCSEASYPWETDYQYPQQGSVGEDGRRQQFRDSSHLRRTGRTLSAQPGATTAKLRISDRRVAVAMWSRATRCNGPWPRLALGGASRRAIQMHIRVSNTPPVGASQSAMLHERISWPDLRVGSSLATDASDPAANSSPIEAVVPD